MKRSNSKTKAQSAFLGVAFVLLIALIGCNQTGGGGNTGGGGGKPTPTPTPKPKHAITFSVEGTNGTLKAKADGVDETSTSPINVEEGKTITFTATAHTGYRLKEWKLDGKTITEAGTKTEYTHTVKKPANITVSFEELSKYAIIFVVEGGNGVLKAKADGIDETSTSPITVEEGKEVTLTATPNEGYQVKEWKLDGKVITEVGIKTEYKHTVTQPAIITMSFELIPPGKAILTLDTDKHKIKVKAKTIDGSAILVEGCKEATLKSDVETELHANGAIITLKGYIIELECRGSYDNKLLIALDVQGLTALQKLDCSYNQLTALNVQGLTALQELNCSYNELPELNVQGLTSLKELNCETNQLTELNVQGCASLQEINCSYNSLPELNVQGLTALQKLDCNDNKLPELNVQGLTSLQELDCDDNKLPELNVQGLTSLQKLDCSENQLTELNVQGLSRLRSLRCAQNQLTALNVQGTQLFYIWCYSNQFNSKAMTELLNSLPAKDIDAPGQAMLYSERPNDNEGNHKDLSNPPELKAAFKAARRRYWQLKKLGASGGDWVDIYIP